MRETSSMPDAVGMSKWQWVSSNDYEHQESEAETVELVDDSTSKRPNQLRRRLQVPNNKNPILWPAPVPPH